MKPMEKRPKMEQLHPDDSSNDGADDDYNRLLMHVKVRLAHSQGIVQMIRKKKSMQPALMFFGVLHLCSLVSYTFFVKFVH